MLIMHVDRSLCGWIDGSFVSKDSSKGILESMYLNRWPLGALQLFVLLLWSYFKEVVQIFELNRVGSASKDYPTPLRFVQTSPRFWSWTFLWDSDRSKLGLLSVKIIIQLMIHPRVFSLFSKSSYKKHYLYNEKLLQRIQLFKEDDTSLQSH